MAVPMRYEHTLSIGSTGINCCLQQPMMFSLCLNATQHINRHNFLSSYDWAEGASPMHTASSASWTCKEFLSMEEYTATQGMPIS